MFQLIVAIGSIFITAGLTIAGIYIIGASFVDGERSISVISRAEPRHAVDVEGGVLRLPANWTTGGDIHAIR